MKIGIEAQRVFRSAKHGMDVVALELIRRLPVRDPHNEYHLFASRGPDKTWIEGVPIATHILPGFSYADWEQVSLPAALARLRPALVHCTANTAPLYSPVPVILTLHDIIYLEKNNSGGSGYQNAGNLYRSMVVPSAVRKAKAIITVSDFEKRIIAARFPDAAHKLSVIYHGVDERFHHRYTCEEIDAFLRQHSLPEEFILFLGNTAPKKNTANVIKAYVHYRELNPGGLPLVMTDYDSRLVKKEITAIGKTEFISSIITPGYISSAAMPLLYNASSLFLYPSLRESFGLPILEAMACGVPVITANTSAMPEVSGTAAKLVDPSDPIAIAQEMEGILCDDALRKDMISRGIARAGYFNWNNATDQLIRLYSDHQH